MLTGNWLVRLLTVILLPLLFLSLLVVGALVFAGGNSLSESGQQSVLQLLSPDGTPAPLGRHCGGIGLTSNTMCGCTWGHVRFQDDPPATGLQDARVELHFAGDTLADITSPGFGEAPYYAMTAERLGARRNDTVTLSATYAGYFVSKDVVLDPDLQSGEQLEDLIFPATRPANLPTPTPIATPVQPSTLGWPRDGYDAAQSRYYPHASMTIPRPSRPFAEVWSYRAEKDSTFFRAYTADVNDDGAIEVVVAYYDTLKVLDGNGVELWSMTIPGWVGEYGSGELQLGLLADWTGDGIADILTSRKTSETVANIYIHDGRGNLVSSFSRSAGVATDGDMHAWAVLEGEDGAKKLYAGLFSNWDPNPRGGLLFDEADGSQDWYYAAGNSLGGSIGDLNGDGIPEIVSGEWAVVSNGSSGCGYGWNTCTDDLDKWIVVLEQDGDELWSRRVGDSFPSGEYGGALRNVVVDLDQDGAGEILALESHYEGFWHSGTSKVHLLDSSDGHIIQTFTGTYNVPWGRAAVADLNGHDGENEQREVIIQGRNGKLLVLDSEFNLVTQADVPATDVHAVNDINGDGHLELILTSDFDDRVVVMHYDRENNHLTSLWQSDPNEPVGATQAIISDLNGDAINDLIVAFRTTNELRVFSQKPWTVPDPTPTPVPSESKSLILVHRERLTRFHPEEAHLVQDELMPKLHELAGHPGVNGSIVDLEDYPDAVRAYENWDEHWPDFPGVDVTTSTAYANAVADSIREIIQSRVEADREVRYIVLVGDDRVIPHRRVQDHSPGGFHEDTYPWVSITTTVGAAMADEKILTDDFYGDIIADIDPRIAHIPDLPVGRLVENPSHIIALISEFLDRDGVPSQPALVVGYGLVKDLAVQQRSILLLDNTVPDELIGDTWSADELRTNLLGVPHYLCAVNVHSSHYAYGAPTGGYVGSDEVASSVLLGGAIIFTPGCQAGLNVPGNNGLYSSLDFAEVFAHRGASYIANTGWGIGDWRGVAFSEKLFAELIARLVAGDEAAVGDVLIAAKRAYYQQEWDFDGIDEKVMLQATLYGMPQYKVREGALMAPAGHPSLIGVGSDMPVDANSTSSGLTRVRLSARYEPVGTAWKSISGPQGRYYSLHDETQFDHGKPAQPKHISNLEVVGERAHGVVFRGGLYEDLQSFNPVVGSASLITGTMPAEPPVGGVGWYPSTLGTLSSIPKEWGGQEQGLALQFGQYNGERRIERLYSRIAVDVYYSDSEDYEAPAVIVCNRSNGGSIDIQVEASDSSGIHRAVVALTMDDGHWRAIDLVRDSSSGVWQGNVPVAQGLEYFVQVVDGAGNVTIDDNGGLYYSVPTPTATLTPTRAPSSTPTAMPSLTSTPTYTPTSTYTATPTPCPTPTLTPTATAPVTVTPAQHIYLPLVLTL